MPCKVGAAGQQGQLPRRPASSCTCSFSAFLVSLGHPRSHVVSAERPSAISDEGDRGPWPGAGVFGRADGLCSHLPPSRLAGLQHLHRRRLRLHHHHAHVPSTGVLQGRRGVPRVSLPAMVSAADTRAARPGREAVCAWGSLPHLLVEMSRSVRSCVGAAGRRLPAVRHHSSPAVSG